MTVLMTCANSFMGSNVVKELIKDGAEVRVTIRKNSDTRNIDDLNLEKIYCDIRDRESAKKSAERM